MKLTIAKKSDEDGWKAVKAGTEVIGHIKKFGDTWRARKGQTEHLGFASQTEAADHLGELSK